MKISNFILALVLMGVSATSVCAQEQTAVDSLSTAKGSEKKDTVAPRSPQAYRVDGVAAVVGNDIVLESDVEGAFTQAQINGATLDEDDKCRILEQLLTDKLLAYQGQVDSLPVTDNDVASSVEQQIERLSYQAGGLNRLLELYQKSDREVLAADLTPIMHSQLFADAMRKKIIGDLNPSPEDVRRYFNSIPKDSLPFFDEEFELSTLVIYPKASEKSRQEVVDRLKQMKKDIEGGSDFRTLAILYSDDTSSSGNGGVYNGVTKGQFVKPFEAVAFNLDEGEISDPVETEFGFHIIQVLKRRGEQLDLRHILMKPKHLPDDLQKAQEQMDSIVAKVRSGELKFDDAVKKFSQDAATKFNNGNMLFTDPSTGAARSYFGVSDLDRNLYYAVSSLKTGQVSDPIFIEDMRLGDHYAIYYVRKHTQPHRADYSLDFNKLKDLAKKDLQNRKLREWVGKKSKEVFVHLNADWANCSFLSDWNKTRRN